MTESLLEQIEDLLVGGSDVMRQLRDMILLMGRTSLPILLVGPTGAGKELVASALHVASGRAGAFTALNVCAVTETMFEDTLFGHVRGAFTGALSTTAGYLRDADGGTLFLDEIGGLAVSAQMKLLRAVETGTFRAVGGAMDLHSDFRLLTATNEDIDMLMTAGRFRRDLLHRISGYTLRVPPLSERREDIPALVWHFARELGVQEFRISAGALRLLQAHQWLGNVRELRRVVERLAILNEGRPIMRKIVRDILIGGLGMPDMADELANRQRLLVLLDRFGWDISEASAELGIHRATLYRRMRRFGVQPPHKRKSKSNAWPPLGMARVG